MGVLILSPQEIARQKGKSIYLIELDKTFKTIKDAARFLQNNNYTSNKSLSSISKNIVRVCNNNKGTAYKMH